MPDTSAAAGHALLSPVGPFRLCALIPTFNNWATLAAVVRRVRRHIEHVIVVDDGSDEKTRSLVGELESSGEILAVYRKKNGGKGAAVGSGFGFAKEQGFTHAFQIDADGQHDLERVSAFVEQARERPEALLLGCPQFSAEAPRSRLVARKITKFWVDIEAGRGVITDAMVGFRIYPLAAALAARVRSTRMDFDIEIAVRLAWRGLPIINLPVAVRYLSPEEGGISHFRLLRDNLRISWLHTRLTTVAICRYLLRPFRRGR